MGRAVPPLPLYAFMTWTGTFFTVAVVSDSDEAGYCRDNTLKAY